MENCIACNGSGYYDSLDKNGNSIKCDNCNGLGKVGGCEYCKGEQKVKGSGDIEDLVVSVDEDDKEMIIDFYDANGNNYQQCISIDFCPMCGNKLIND